MAEAIRRPAKSFLREEENAMRGGREGRSGGPAGILYQHLFSPPPPPPPPLSPFFSRRKRSGKLKTSLLPRVFISTGRLEEGREGLKGRDRRKNAKEEGKRRRIFLNRDSASPVGDEGRRATPYPDFKRCRVEGE